MNVLQAMYKVLKGLVAGLVLNRVIPERKSKEFYISAKFKHPIHGLLEDDSDCRLQFGEISEIPASDVNIFYKIICSDEATFTLPGHVSRHNCTHWYTRQITYKC